MWPGSFPDFVLFCRPVCFSAEDFYFCCCLRRCTKRSMPTPPALWCPTQGGAACASAAALCCVNSLNTDGAARLYTWQVHGPGSSPSSSAVNVCHARSVLRTCCSRLYWSDSALRLWLLVSPSLCVSVCGRGYICLDLMYSVAEGAAWNVWNSCRIDMQNM